MDTATSLGQGGDKGFFKSQAQTHIAHALEKLNNAKPNKSPPTKTTDDSERVNHKSKNLCSILGSKHKGQCYQFLLCY